MRMATWKPDSPTSTRSGPSMGKGIRSARGRLRLKSPFRPTDRPPSSAIGKAAAGALVGEVPAARPSNTVAVQSTSRLCTVLVVQQRCNDELTGHTSSFRRKTGPKSRTWSGGNSFPLAIPGFRLKAGMTIEGSNPLFSPQFKNVGLLVPAATETSS